MSVDSRRIKLMQVTRSLNVGGLEKLVALLAKKLDPEIFDVSICCLLRKGFFADELEEKGVKIHLVADDPAKARSRLLFLKLFKLLRREKPDILHTHNTHPMMDGTIAGKLARVSVLVHTDHARNFPDQLKYMVIESVLSHFVDRVVAVSQYSKQDLVRYEKISPSKITVIPNGVDFEVRSFDRSSLVDELELAGADPVIGTVCRLTEQKGTKYLVGAMPEVVARYPAIKLMIVGDGVMRPELESRVAELGIESNVAFYGYQQDVVKYIQAMDLFVSSSVWEGMPLGLLEVMSCGKPIVATTVGGVPEVVEDGVTGFLTNSGSSEDLANTILKALDNRSAFEAMGGVARSRYGGYFTEDIMLARYQELYLDLMQRKGIRV